VETSIQYRDAMTSTSCALRWLATPDAGDARDSRTLTDPRIIPRLMSPRSGTCGLVSEHRVRMPGIVPRCPTGFAAPPDVLLVIDIEGGELDLCELLQLDGVRKVLIEVHEWAIGRDGLAAVERTFAGAGLHRDADLSTERVWFLRRA
jgi:hypothetical protein